jgi:hypothetical protein
MMLSSVDLGLPPWEIIAFLTSGIALNSFALSGKLLCLPSGYIFLVSKSKSDYFG